MHNMLRSVIATATAAFFMVSCAPNAQKSRPLISVSLPVEAYFVERIAGNAVDVNIMIPQSAGHGDYTPRPSQMRSIAQSDAYLAIGPLDFEQTWRERLTANADSMKWIDLSNGIEMLSEDEHEGHHHAVNPHYWLSPRQVKTMVANMAKALEPVCEMHFDSALAVLNAEIDEFDSLLTSSTKDRHIAFMIYHPALDYLAHDYGMKQFEIEKHGNAPSPQTYMNEIDNARQNGVSVVFVQQGYDQQKAQSAAEMIGARVVEFSPEGIDWPATMNIIIESFGR